MRVGCKCLQIHCISQGVTADEYLPKVKVGYYKRRKIAGVYQSFTIGCFDNQGSSSGVSGRSGIHAIQDSENLYLQVFL